MKKIYYLLILLIMSFLSIGRVQAQDVVIPDANFKAALVANTDINTNSDGEIQVAEAAAFTGAIDVSNKSITSLDGIEEFTSVSQLNCSFNSLAILDISANAGLYNLDCQQNQLTNLILNTYLDRLICNNNQLTSLDVSANTYLSTFICYDNMLTSLNLSANPGMFQFGCGNNQLGSLDISSCTNLYIFDCTNNQLSSLDISLNTHLFAIYCSSNQLSGLDVSANTSLGILTCQHNQLTSIDVSNNLALFALDVEANNITSIDVSINSRLENLNCGYNQLSTLNVSANTALRYLACHYNQISSLDISANTSLTQLGCVGNQLTSLDLSTNVLLDDLGCDFNQLTSLDVSQNTALISFFCGNNQLTSLDVSASTALIQLYCANNKLISLNVKNGNNTNLNYFYATGNSSLTCIQVDDPAYMNATWSAGKDATANYSSNCGSCATYFASLGLQSGSPSSICIGGNTNLAVNITGASSSNTYFDIHYTDGTSGFNKRVFVSGSNVTAAFSVSPTETTNYKFTSITDANGCSGLIGPASSDTFELVTVSVLPTITANPFLTTDLCPGTQVKLTSSRAPSYTWSNGKTTRSVTVIQAGSYTVSTTTASGCQGTSQAVEVSYQVCGFPTGIGINNVTGNAAEISFTGPSCGQGYELRYKIRKTTGWTTITGIAGSPYTLGGLASNTSYIMQMRTLCSSNPVRYSAWTISYSFKTAISFTNSTQTGNALKTNSLLDATIYPNPAIDHAMIYIRGTDKPVTITLTDMTGKILQQYNNISIKQYQLSLNNLTSGVYLVILSDGENKETLKLVKE